MAKPVPTLHITYDELLEHTREMLHMFSRHSCTPMDAFDRGLHSGAIHLWRSLVIGMDETVRDYRGDYKQLRLLAGLTADDQEPPADAH